MKLEYLDKKNSTIEYFNELVNIPFSNETKYFKYDFNNGFRICFLDTSIKYKIIIMDKNTRCIYYENMIFPESDVMYLFSKKYYIEYEIIILRMITEDLYDSIPISTIEYDINNKNVLFLLSTEKNSHAGLGDCIAWLTSIYKFKLNHPSTEVYVYMDYAELEELIKLKYDCFNFINYEDIKNISFYSTYLIGCFFEDSSREWCPDDYKDLSLVEYGYSILGLEFDKEFSLDLSIESEENNEEYVCIATHASSIYKEWLNKNGWEQIISLLNEYGYKVYVIDAEEENSENIFFKTVIPTNAINKTGFFHLKERAKIISGAKFFIGLSSGLSWLAWTCKVPVVLISGFTSPNTEFFTKYRVINKACCNSCWNDKNISWDISKTVCPRCENPFSESFIECSTKINVYTVIDKIKQIPCVKKRMRRFFDSI